MPTDQQIKALHRRYAKTEADFDLIYQHCIIVEAIAMRLLDAKPVAGIDRQLVHVGSLLHDIGAYDVIENGQRIQGVRHGVIGEEILRSAGLPESVWRIASHHTGVGLTAQDVIEQGLPIPPADYTAHNYEEQLIMYADKFHTKDIPQPHFYRFEDYHSHVQQFGPDKAARFDSLAAQFGKPDIEALAIEFGHDVKNAS